MSEYQFIGHNMNAWKDIELVNDIDRLVQERPNSSVLALELHLSCANPLIL